MKFRSPTDEPVYLALTNGHCTVVGVDYTEIDPRFNREAIAAGCIPEGVEIPAEPKAEPSFDRKQVILDAMNDMMDGAVDGDFTRDGRPSIDRLTARIGFNIDRAERDAVWAEIAK